tara:strand:- start:4814 stop:5188 length:375 start_codon:yes stop_codon:yes gene_type:complete
MSVHYKKTFKKAIIMLYIAFLICYTTYRNKQKEYIMIMTSTQKADRLALIKKIGDRRNKMAKLKKASVKQVRTVNARPVVRKTNVMQEPAYRENIYQWTDASKYADQYYGDTMRETTKFDNDWD